MRIAAQGHDSYRRWLPWLELGLVVGVAILLRQLFMFVVPLVLLWLLWITHRNDQRLVRSWTTWLRFAVTIAVAAALILPWTARNYQVFGRLVPLNTNSGYAFFWANHPIHGTSFVSILPDEGPSYQQLIPSALRSLDEAALDQALLRLGVGFVVQDPLRYALLSLSRIKDYFMFWPSADSSAVSNVARVGSFGILLPFMLLGAIRSRHAVRARQVASTTSWLTPSAGLNLLALFVVIYTLIHLLSWALIRYRLPVDGVLLIFAGLGLVQAIEYTRTAIVATFILGKERVENGSSY